MTKLRANLNNDNAKGKRKDASPAMPLDFVVPMQLEAMRHTIENDPAHQPPSKLEITTTSSDNDVMWFRVWLYDTRGSGKLLAQAAGDIRRWEGTSARVQGTLIVPKPYGLHPRLYILWLVILPCPLTWIVVFAAVVQFPRLVTLPEVALLICISGFLMFILPLIAILRLNEVLYRRQIESRIKALLGASVR